MTLSEHFSERLRDSIVRKYEMYLRVKGERGDSVVERRTPEREVGGSKPTSAVLFY